MAKMQLLSNGGLIALSSSAHAPHYLGKASYVGTTTITPQGAWISLRNASESVYLYRIANCPYAPLAFVQLSSTSYAVRAVYSSGANQWDILVSYGAGGSGVPPSVFCFGRIAAAKPGGPAIRLFDSSGLPAFDSQSRPLRAAGRLDFPALDSSYTASQSLALPTGMVQPAIADDCSGYGFTYTKSGSYWRPGVYAARWSLSGANLARGFGFVQLTAQEDGSGANSGHFDGQSPVVIETYGLT